MTERFSHEARRALMSGIRGKDTEPEMAVRRMLHAMGYRFRLHRRDLPGTPDLVFPALPGGRFSDGGSTNPLIETGLDFLG